MALRLDHQMRSYLHESRCQRDRQANRPQAGGGPLRYLDPQCALHLRQLYHHVFLLQVWRSCLYLKRQAWWRALLSGHDQSRAPPVQMVLPEIESESEWSVSRSDLCSSMTLILMASPQVARLSEPTQEACSCMFCLPDLDLDFDFDLNAISKDHACRA